MKLGWLNNGRAENLGFSLQRMFSEAFSLNFFVRARTHGLSTDASHRFEAIDYRVSVEQSNSVAANSGRRSRSLTRV